MILETATPSQPARRLPHVKYLSHPIGKQRWLNTRLHPYLVAWFTNASKRLAARISQSINGFEFESIFTVAHGFGWLAAAEIANKRGVPLHLAVHDDWPRVADIAPQFRDWLDEQFARVYRQAHLRLCVSPAMSRFYEQRYGKPATVIYPSRAKDATQFAEPPARLGKNESQFTIAFAGTINSQGYIDALKKLQQALKLVSGRLLVFGPLTDNTAQQIGLDDPNTNDLWIVTCGAVTHPVTQRRRRPFCSDVVFSIRSRQHGNGVSQQTGRLHCHGLAAVDLWACLLFGSDVGA